MNESIDLLQCHFGLTPSEARLALRLVAGDKLQSAAVKLDISYGTARGHLKNIFNKTGAHRQAELVVLIVMALPACLEAAPAGPLRPEKSSIFCSRGASAPDPTGR